MFGEYGERCTCTIRHFTKNISFRNYRKVAEICLNAYLHLKFKICNLEESRVSLTILFHHIPNCKGNLRGVMANVLDCDIVVNEFELKSGYYVPFQTNTLGKGMNSLIPSNYDFNSTTKVLLQG